MTKFSEEVKWLALTIPASGLMCGLGAMTASTLGADLDGSTVGAAFLGGATLASGVWTLRQFGKLASGRRAPQVQLSSNYRWGLEHPEDLTRSIRWKERPEYEQFVFSGQGLVLPIPETTLLRFCKVAWRRQMNALYGSQVNLMWTEQGNYRRLTVNQIFSERHYLQSQRPRFQKLEYESCFYILIRLNLVIDRRQGRSGTLRFEPGLTVEIARERWLPSPTRKNNNFWRSFTTSRS